MKKFIFSLLVTLVFIAGCNTVAHNTESTPQPQASTPSQAVTPPATDSPDVISTIPKSPAPANIYPDRNAKIGQKYGEMTLKSIGNTSQDPSAHFTGEVTLTGSYQYYDKDSPFSGEAVCFTSMDPKEGQKLPQSHYIFSEKNPADGAPVVNFCFENLTLAKKLLGTGKGTATVTINAYDSVIDAEYEINNTATLEKVLTKTEQKN